MEVVDALDQTFAHTRRVIAAVTPTQYGDPTPCTEWTVRDLLEHMVGVVAGLGAAAAGTAPAPFELGADPAAQFGDVATAAIDAWRRPGVLESVVNGAAGAMPGHVYASINLLDTATHTWDLATATGQPTELPEPVAHAAMEASRAIVTDQLRPGRFAAEQHAPADASPTQQLVAFLGRSAVSAH